MIASVCLSLLLSIFALPAGVQAVLALPVVAQALPIAAKPKQPILSVDEVRAGMKGHGLTVMKGTKVEPFQVEILGVLKNTSPGRDMILARLSGLGLERTGVIAGMSGSPVYIDGKLLGAVAYAWPYGKEPIAGITPFTQMQNYVLAHDQKESRSKPVGLQTPLHLDGKTFASAQVAAYHEPATAAADDTLTLMPLQTPIAATGFTPHALKLLKERLGNSGLVPMQGGAAASDIVQESQQTPLVPGGVLGLSLITGDFDLSGIGTVTHVDGEHVYGWGHPFMSIGRCELPMMTGYIHTVYPRQTVSFKMGSPLQMVGVVNADVSTCIAGWLGRKPDMVPLKMTVRRDPGDSRTFQVQVVRQRQLFPTLVYTALTNSVDMEGDLPEELTAELMLRIELEHHSPIVWRDTFSGGSFSGSRAPIALYSQVGALLTQLTHNSFAEVRIVKIECETLIRPGRTTADIHSVELQADEYAPGDTLVVDVFLRPHRGNLQRKRLHFPLPADLPEGKYSLTICDDAQRLRLDLRDQPLLAQPQSLTQLLEAIRRQTEVKRNLIALRLPTKSSGVTLEANAYPKLPGSMVQILGQGRRTGPQLTHEALTVRQPTPWIIQGSEVVSFQVRSGKPGVP